MKKFWDNFEEYLCALALVIMALVTFINVFSRKVSFINLSFTQELVTTMFVWVCCLAAASAFKTDSHMGFAYITDKLTGNIKKIHTLLRSSLITINYIIWLIYGIDIVYRQAHYHMLTGVLEMPIWMIGIAIPLSAVLSVIRLWQYTWAHRNDGVHEAVNTAKLQAAAEIAESKQ